jgi:uncharacterized protein
MVRRDDRDDDLRLPIAFHPLSNGEYAPLPRNDVVREAVRRTLEAADVHARRLGISRRAFLRSAAGMATTLSALAACSSEKSRANPTTTGASRSTSSTSGSTTTAATSTSSTTSTTSTVPVGPGGTFTVPTEATVEETVATTVLAAPGDFVMDVQTHFLEYASEAEATFGGGFPQASCGGGVAECLGLQSWLDLVLTGSDTSIAVISAVPVVADPDPLSTEVMERGRRAAEEIGCNDRVLIQGHAAPSIGPLGAALDAMAATAATFDIAAWKAYTHAGPAWRLDDEIGTAFCDQVRALGQRIVCVHKGFGPAAASPVDVGPAAARHPDLTFCIYHSGFEGGVTEGPYPGDEEGARAGGVDRLIASVRTAGIGPGGNVYAELGSTWWNLIQRPDEAAHVLGKLLVTFGPDNILWGTDSIWYGSPQSQIEAFRVFEISPEYQERFGYPALTPDVKAKILGLNAARVYGVDTTIRACAADRSALRAELVDRPAGPRTAAGARALFASEHPWFERGRFGR